MKYFRALIVGIVLWVAGAWGASLALAGLPPFLVNNPTKFSWTSDAPIDIGNVNIFPFDATYGCDGNFTRCCELFQPCVGAIYLDQPASTGTVTIQECTPEVTSYRAVFTTYDTHNEEVIRAQVTFQVQTDNTLTMKAYSPYQHGVAFEWTAPKYHSVYDHLYVVDLNCTQDTPDDCLVWWDYPLSGFSKGTSYIDLSGLEVGRPFVARWYVGRAGYLSTQTQVFVKSQPTGTCGSECTNQGAVCVDDDNCTQCGDDLCIVVKPTVTDLKGQSQFTILRVVGDTQVTFQVMTTTIGDPTKLQMFVSELMPGLSWARSAQNASVYTVTWQIDSDIQTGTYDLHLWVMDERGVRSDDLCVTLEFREEYCTIWGDPHIVTFDGTMYDFQGAGEFVALRPRDPLSQMPACARQFWVHGWNAPCFDANVTCLVGVAFPTPGGVVSMHSRWDEATQTETLTVIYDSDYIVLTEEPRNFTVRGAVVGSLKLVDGEVIADFLKCAGVKLRFRGAANELVVSVNSLWWNHSVGMCGTFNGNEYDDFTLLDGRVVFQTTAPQATPQNIYKDFGMPLHVAKGVTLFNYSMVNTTYEVENPTSWRPIFDPVFDTPEAEVQAGVLCGHLPGAGQGEISACRFDVAAAGPAAAFRALDNLLMRCMEETDGSECSPPAGCENWCNLAGECVKSGNTHQCNCDDGYVGPHCTPSEESVPHSSVASREKSEIIKSGDKSEPDPAKSSSQPVAASSTVPGKSSHPASAVSAAHIAIPSFLFFAAASWF